MNVCGILFFRKSAMCSLSFHVFLIWLTMNFVMAEQSFAWQFQFGQCIWMRFLPLWLQLLMKRDAYSSCCRIGLIGFLLCCCLVCQACLSQSNGHESAVTRTTVMCRGQLMHLLCLASAGLFFRVLKMTWHKLDEKLMELAKWACGECWWELVTNLLLEKQWLLLLLSWLLHWLTLQWNLVVATIVVSSIEGLSLLTIQRPDFLAILLAKLLQWAFEVLMALVVSALPPTGCFHWHWTSVLAVADDDISNSSNGLLWHVAGQLQMESACCCLNGFCLDTCFALHWQK